MRATNLKFMLAVSVLLLTMVCTTVPAWARVDIMANGTGEANEVIISFDATSELNLIRAFSLDIRLGYDVNIVEVTGISPDYYIFPGTIWIDAYGNVIDYGTALAEYSDLPSGTLPGLDSNSITIEMASLYAPVGPTSPNAAAKFGDLVSIRVSGEFCQFPTYASCAPVSEYCCITISGNVARAGSTGVVMEDPNEVVDVYFHNICDPPPLQCMKATSPDYGDWIDWDCPVCWCYIKQCRGDINGSLFLGKPITLSDLNVFKAAFNQSNTVVQGIAGGICADLNHAAFLNKRVTLGDLNTFKLYFNKPEASVPECDNTNYNFWETP